MTVNVICEGKVIKTKSEMIEKDKQYTDFAEEISGYILNEYNVKSVIVNNNTTISFDYKKVELVDTFNMKIYVDYVSHYELLSNAEKIKAINTILSILI